MVYLPPGFVNDLTEENMIGWSAQVNEFMPPPDVSPQFYGGTEDDEEEQVNFAVVTWTGFPRRVGLLFPNDDQRWQAADESRDVQDEFLEWSVRRDANGMITKIVFSTESPEYFEFLAVNQPQTLLALYQQHNPDANIVEAELYTEDGRYNGRNQWNNSTTTGTIMHLIQPNNTLRAGIDIAARATIVRRRGDGTIITDEEGLITCSWYGNPNRNSDPQIGISFNNLVRQQPRRVTIDNPVGLYIEGVNWGMVEPPEGHEDDDPSEFWTWTRGTEEHYMRAVFEVPEGKGYVVGDLRVNGQPLNRAAQLADHILVSITAKTSAWGGAAEPQLCPGPEAVNSLRNM